MIIKKVNEHALKEWINCLIDNKSVIGIQAKDDKFAFAPLKNAEDLRLDYDVSLLPPKEFLLPQKETLASFKKGEGYESVIDNKPFVLLGVHPYDMEAISQMDEIFSQENYDEHYMARRKKAVIIVVDVQSVSENVFAGYMGTSHVESGYDILLTKLDNEYLVDAGTKQGKALMSKLENAPDADENDIEQRKNIWTENKQKLRQHELKADSAEWSKLLESGYEHPVWEEKAKLCFSCGSCNLVCPTCYCFDVHDDVEWNLEIGKRYRVWDSCMLEDFAKVAGGHNFRGEKAARYRHRYYRKGKYVPSKIGGRIACVGCGRCITACVAKIANPVEIFNRLKETK